jgi:hypothetical protein
MEEFQAGGLTAEASRDIRKIFSRIGLALTADILIVSGLQFLIGFVCSSYFPAATESGWYVWTTSFLPQFLVGAPVCLFLLQSKNRRNRWRQARRGKYCRFLYLHFRLYIGIFIGALVTGARRRRQYDSNRCDRLKCLGYPAVSPVILAPIVEELISARRSYPFEEVRDKLAIFVSRCCLP